ncbi:MAG TPA: TIGR03435 family protein, partial [Candidatus Acidoferrales bacterium]|nr:TIGR03435 family protein [Candidatus Acidoferrales bacterium]
MNQTNRDSRSTPFANLRMVLLFAAAFCGASALPFLNVRSSAAQATSANGQLATQPNAPSEAQATDAPLPSFEVASIKKHATDNEGGRGIRVMMGGPDVSQFRASNVTAKMLIASAYSVKEFQISTGPSWISSERWDINAKVEDSQAAQLQKLTRQEQQAQQALMIRSLLADRFKLHLTRSTKEGTVLALVVAKGGPKLKEVPPPDPHAGPPPPPLAPPERGSSPPTPPPGGSMMMMNGNTGVATLSSNAMPISNLVNMLSMQVGQQVVDQTGLKGTYQFTLQFAPQIGLGGMPPPPGAETSAADSS